MNLKAANIIVVELGILIGLMSWLAYSRFPSTEPRTAAEKLQESTAAPVATVASVSEPGKQRPSTIDYRTDPEQARLVAEQQALTRYQQEIAPRPYASSRAVNGSIAADSLSYAELDQEQAVASSEEVASPQTVAYVQPTQIVVYPQPAQIIVFSNPRRFANRCRSTSHSDVLLPITNRCPDKGESNLNRRGMVPRRDAGAPSCRPIQGFRPRDHR